MPPPQVGGMPHSSLPLSPRSSLPVTPRSAMPPAQVGGLTPRGSLTPRGHAHPHLSSTTSLGSVNLQTPRSRRATMPAHQASQMVAITTHVPRGSSVSVTTQQTLHHTQTVHLRAC